MTKVALQYRKGDAVIYRVPKHSASPGPRAEAIDPEPRGEHYSYEVDKYWRVHDIRSDGKLCLRTRRGKEHVVSPRDPRLRRPHLWERLVYAGRFPDANG